MVQADPNRAAQRDYQQLVNQKQYHLQQGTKKRATPATAWLAQAEVVVAAVTPLLVLEGKLAVVAAAEQILQIQS